LETAIDVVIMSVCMVFIRLWVTWYCNWFFFYTFLFFWGFC